MNQSIQRLLDGLPEEERLILTLYYRSEKSSFQIAELLGVPEEVIARMVSTSKTKLLGMLSLGE
jgi:RNA polymerase sigma factor (sigma-70 family)